MFYLRATVLNLAPEAKGIEEIEEQIALQLMALYP